MIRKGKEARGLCGGSEVRGLCVLSVDKVRLIQSIVLKYYPASKPELRAGNSEGRVVLLRPLCAVRGPDEMHDDAFTLCQICVRLRLRLRLVCLFVLRCLDQEAKVTEGY